SPAGSTSRPPGSTAAGFSPPPPAGPTDRPCERRADKGHRVLPPAVPSDPGERRMVGRRVHRVDERRRRDAPVSGAPPTTPPGRAGLLRPPRPGGARASGRARPPARYRRLHVLPLLVRRRAHPRPRLRRGLAVRAARLPLCPVLGERELDASV